MRVLLSIKPEFASKIFDGSKKYEYRRVIFKRSEVTTAIVYASAPVGKVLGEFEVGEILHEEPEVLWQETGQHGGITRERLFSYFGNKKKGYAIKVKEARRYERPLPLSGFVLIGPPQSFMYLR